MRGISASIIAFVAAALTALVVAAPGAAAAELDETRDAVWGVVWAADASNQLIIIDFVSEGIAAQNRSELDSARSRANTALDSVWYSSVAQLEDLLALFPDELADDVASATSRLLSDHDAARAEITDLYWEIHGGLQVPGAPTSTTTASPSTTTTTTATNNSTSTTTTTSPSTTTTTTSTTLPAPSTSTTTSSTTTTLASTTTTRPPAVAGTTDTLGPSEPTRTVGDTLSMEELVGADDTAFALPQIGGGSVDSDEASAPNGSGSPEVAAVGSGSAPVSRLMVEIGETIQVPERLIQFMVAPVVMAEILFGILFESLQSLLVPVAVLLVAVGVFVWRERRRPYDVGLARSPR